MNEPLDPTRFALGDDELEGLLSGTVDPSSAEYRDNPIAAFFTEARSVSFAAGPEPDQALSELFAAGRPVGTWIGRPSAAANGRSGGAASVGLGAVARSREVAGFDPEPTQSSPVGRPRPVTQTHRVIDGYDGWAIAPDDDALRREVMVTGDDLYRPSPLAAVADIVRPTGTKVLMVASVALLLLIGAQLLGFLELPSSQDREGETLAGAETDLEPTTTTIEPTTSVSPRLTLATVPSVRSASSVASTQPATTRPRETTRATQSSERGGTTATSATATSSTATSSTATSSTATSSTATSSTATSTETSSTTAAEPATSSSIETSTTAPSSSTSVASTTTATSTTEPSTTSASDTTTTTTDPATVSITPNTDHAVPADLPAGTYQAVVGAGSGCTVELTRADASVETVVAGPGATITFTVLDGWSVRTSAGCPLAYQLNVA